MALNQILGGRDLTADPVAQARSIQEDRDRQALSYILTQQQMQQQQNQANMQNELARRELGMKQQAQDFAIQQAQQAQKPFNLKEALFQEVQSGRATPEVYQGLGMYVEPQQAVTPKTTKQEGITKTEATQSGLDKDQLKFATDLRKEFQSSDIYKNAQVVADSANKMQKAFEMSTSPDQKSRIASDQTLGVLFQKLLDPTSVVRESEYARTPEGASVINRAMAFIPALQKGGLALTDSDRKAIYDMARELQTVAEQAVNKQVNVYGNLADTYGVPRDLVLGQYGAFAQPTVNPSTMQAPSAVANEQRFEFSDEATAELASQSLPKGTVIYINGKRAVTE